MGRILARRHVSRPIDQWLRAAESLTRRGPARPGLLTTFSCVLQFVHRSGWEGACHASSSVLFVLLREQGIHAELYLGEVRAGRIFFDHSWVEVDSKVFDVAISSPLIHDQWMPPVFASIDLSSLRKTTVVYGVSSGAGHNESAALIRTLPFAEYMGAFPRHESGLWGVAKELGKEIGLRIAVRKLRSTYADVLWKERP